MEKMRKIIKKDKIMEILKNGGYVTWDSIYAKASLHDKNHVYIGGIRFKTYLSLSLESKVEIDSYGYKQQRKYLKTDNKNNVLKAYIPKLDELSNEDLYKIMNYIQKEISRRHKEDLKDE
jgi:hypothetical protein